MAGTSNRAGAGASAFVEWFAGVVVGALPLAAHALARAISNRAEVSRWQDLCGEILFVVIVTCGTIMMSVTVDMVRRGGAFSPHFGARCMLLTVANLLFLVAAALIYGFVAADAASRAAINWAVSLLVGSVCVSRLFEWLLNEIKLLDEAASA